MASACPLQRRGLAVATLAPSQAAGGGCGGLVPSSWELFPPPTRSEAPAQGVLAKPSQPQARFGRPTGLPPGGSTDASDPILPPGSHF